MNAATLIVVPTFNEADNIAALLAAIGEELPAAHVLIVDDGSPDGTAAIVRGLPACDERIHLLERPRKLGLGSAYVAGFAWGMSRGFERFFEMDADFSHDPHLLHALTTSLDAGADVVVGSRNVPGAAIEGWGPLRLLLSKGSSLYARLILQCPVRDMTTGFKGYTRRALELIDIASLRSNGYAFQVETTYRAFQRGLRITEVPILFVDRRAGQSKMSSHEIGEAAIAVWRMRCRAIVGCDGGESSTYSQARTRSRCKMEGRATRSRR
jgi:dolichol-phosphate mannosyltransferase